MTAMRLETMGADICAGVAVIEFSRPAQRNSIGRQWLADLRGVFAWVEATENTRAVVLHGREHFSAGGDLHELSDFSDDEELAEFLGAVQSCVGMVSAFRLPVIAAVEGYALGGGTELALACDFVVASSAAEFGLPEIKVGVLPGGGGIARLAKLVGLHKAKELVLLGRRIPAEEAHALGLAADVVSPGEALRRARELAGEIAQLPPVAVGKAKRLLNIAHDTPLEVGLREEIAASVALRRTQDHREGLAAFAERRKPLYRGQ